MDYHTKLKLSAGDIEQDLNTEQLSVDQIRYLVRQCYIETFIYDNLCDMLAPSQEWKCKIISRKCTTPKKYGAFHLTKYLNSFEWPDAQIGIQIGNVFIHFAIHGLVTFEEAPAETDTITEIAIPCPITKYEQLVPIVQQIYQYNTKYCHAQCPYKDALFVEQTPKQFVQEVIQAMQWNIDLSASNM